MVRERTGFLMKIILIIFAVQLFPISVAFSSSNFEVSYTTYNTTYEKIIQMYIRVLNAYGTKKEGRHDLFNDMIISDFHHDFESPMKNRIAEAKNRVGFCIYDLNGDGIDELIIGENEVYINEVFTMDDGKVRELIRAWGKYSCSLLKNGYFYRYTYIGGGMNSETIWKMNGTGKVTFVEGYYRNEEYNGFSPDVKYEYYLDNWFRIKKDPNKYKVDFTEENKAPRGELLRWMKEKDDEILHLHFIPLAVYEKGIEINHIGIIVKDGRTNINETVKIRKDPSKKSKVIMSTKIGTYVNVLGEEGDYYKIRIKNKTGYIQKEFLVSLEDNPWFTAKQHSIYPYDNVEYLIKEYGEQDYFFTIK